MMFRLRGGIRPAGRKERTRRKTLSDIEVLPQEVTLFLKQSTGGAATPVVALGQRVAEGECIAQGAEDGVSVHASLPGIVVAIEPRPDFRGKLRPAIVIQVGEGEFAPPMEIDWETISPDEMIRLSRELGLVEMVGQPVPTHQKILDARGRADTLIINGTESEPYLTATHRLGLERGRDLIVGARLLARVMGVNRVIFATTGDQLTVIERLERDLRRGDRGETIGRAMTVKTLRAGFPLGYDSQIVLRTTGREIPPGGDAVDVGCQVFCLATVCALGRAFVKGTPITRVPFTVSGLAVVRPRNLWVPVGASLHNLLENCNGVEEEPSIALVGGLITGQKVNRLRAPVEKWATGLLCLQPSELPVQESQQTCLQCGRCIQVCPMGLCPVFVLRSVVGGQMERLEALHPQDCLQCGACASVCPSHIPLNRSMRQGGDMVVDYQRERGEKE